MTNDSRTVAGRRRVLAGGAALAASTVLHGGAVLGLGGFAGGAFAQGAAAYPAKPINMVVGFAAGSATDIVGRVIGQKLSDRLGKAVVVQNVTGAGSTLATESVVRAAPDGYTLTTVSGALAVGPAVYPNLKFDVERDLTPIGLIGFTPIVLMVNDGVPAQTMNELVELAKKRPGQLNFGSSGTGGSTQMAAELFSQLAGIKMTHVPYRGNGPAGAAIMGGEIQVLMDTVLLGAQAVKTGRVRALAVTGKTRAPQMPDVPTFAEAGLPAFEASILFGMLGPAGMPRDIVERLNRELNAVLDDAEVRQKLVGAGGMQMAVSTPEQFGALLRDEIAKWKRVAQQAGVRAE